MDFLSQPAISGKGSLSPFWKDLTSRILGLLEMLGVGLRDQDREGSHQRFLELCPLNILAYSDGIRECCVCTGELVIERSPAGTLF